MTLDIVNPTVRDGLGTEVTVRKTGMSLIPTVNRARERRLFASLYSQPAYVGERRSPRVR